MSLSICSYKHEVHGEVCLQTTCYLAMEAFLLLLWLVECKCSAWLVMLIMLFNYHGKIVISHSHYHPWCVIKSYSDCCYGCTNHSLCLVLNYQSNVDFKVHIVCKEIYKQEFNAGNMFLFPLKKVPKKGAMDREKHSYFTWVSLITHFIKYMHNAMPLHV